jgi:enoyl-[acyl-carrier protein] reductase II
VTASSGELCALLGIERPILQAGMGWVSTGRLAAAVSAAGGLGVIATGGVMSPEELRGHIVRVRDEAPGRPFGVNVLLPAGADAEAGFANRRLLESQLELCLQERVPVVVSGLGDPAAVVPRIHAYGLRFVAVVGAVRAAIKAAAAGADAIIAQGHEAGGHVGPIGTLTLAQSVRRAVAVPFAVAGGIATADSVAAALALGAGGVSVGTRFIASEESDAHPTYKQAVVSADQRATVVTTACTGKPSRALRNGFTESWAGRQEEIQPYPAQADDEFWRARSGCVDGDVEDGFLPMGQCAALVDDVLPAAEIVARLAAPVEALA